MSEARFSRNVSQHARKRGVEFAWKVNDRTTGGIPDHYFRGSRQALWVEAKYMARSKIPTEVKNLLSEKQRSRFAEMRAAGAEIWVVYAISVAGKVHAVIVDASQLHDDRFPILQIMTTPELAQLIITTTSGAVSDEQTVR